MTEATKQTTAQRFRDYLREHGPQTNAQLQAAFGMSFAQVWGHCRPQVAAGRLLFDEATNAYCFGREARKPRTEEERKANKRAGEAVRNLRRYHAMTPEQREVYLAKRRDYEAKRREERRSRRAPKPAAKAAKPRGSMIRLVQNKEARQRDHETRKSTRAASAQAMRRKECGLVDRPAAPVFPSSSAFIAANPDKFQRLGNGVVSKHSQFQRLQVRA